MTPFFFCLVFVFLILANSSLGLGWNYPCDLWSVGCILVELCSVSLLRLFVLEYLINLIHQLQLCGACPEVSLAFFVFS